MRTYQTIARTAKGFTLVELIVVISVLAVLATIAFTSVSNISMSARNSKRTTDISTIRSQIAIKMSGGSTLASMVDGSSSSFTANLGTTGTLAGWQAVTDSGATGYVAGNVNYAGLGMKQGDFSDPDSTDKYYKIGKMNYAGGVYELASSNEAESGRIPFVSGTYMPRTTNGSSGDIKSATTFKLTNLADVGKWSVNDQITIAGANSYTGKIKSVDVDGVITITSPSTMVANVGQSIYLSGATTKEAAGLINGGSNIPVTNGGTALPY